MRSSRTRSLRNTRRPLQKAKRATADRPTEVLTDGMHQGEGEQQPDRAPSRDGERPDKGHARIRHGLRSRADRGGFPGLVQPRETAPSGRRRNTGPSGGHIPAGWFPMEGNPPCRHHPTSYSPGRNERRAESPDWGTEPHDPYPFRSHSPAYKSAFI